MSDSPPKGWIMAVAFAGWILAIVFPPMFIWGENRFPISSDLNSVVNIICSFLFIFTLLSFFGLRGEGRGRIVFVVSLIFMGLGFYMRGSTYGGSSLPQPEPTEEITNPADITRIEPSKELSPEKGLDDYFALLQRAIDGDLSFVEAWNRLSDDFRERNLDSDLDRYIESWENTYFVDIEIDSLATILGITTAEIHAVYTVKTTSGTGINPFIYCMIYVDHLWKIDWVNKTVHCELD